MSFFNWFKKKMYLSRPSTSDVSNEDQKLVIPLEGNSFLTSKSENSQAEVTKQGWVNWTEREDVFSMYFKVNKPGKLKVFASLNVPSGGSSILQCSLHGLKSFRTCVSGASNKDYSFGNWEIDQPGYVRLDVQGESRTSDFFANMIELRVSGSAVDSRTLFVKNNNGNMFYWGRRGPSVHLNYFSPELVNQNIEYFYSEVTVPEGFDQIGSFVMAAGFGEGYFGIQVNSETERRILFSVWSPFETDDPNSVPEEMRIRCLEEGDGVQACEFGCEGSGGQSFLRYPWSSNTTYKFLLRAQPNLIPGSTTFTAYFYAPELSIWLLICRFSRPCLQTWLTRLHSFVENFIPENGHLTRKCYFYNQWVCMQNGQWKAVNRAHFTGDETAKKGYRMDYEGGVEDGRFYLKHCGFFDGKAELDTVFEVGNDGSPPEINFSELDV